MAVPDFLVIGHVTKDIVEGGFAIGGTVTYSSLTARNLGLRTALLTRAAEGLDFGAALPGIDVLRLPASATTTFENRYPGGRRVQYLRALAEPIPATAVPDDWRQASIVHVGPLAQELTADILARFPGALTGVTPQGWMRRWDEHGRVFQQAWEVEDNILAHADVIIFSREDVGEDAAAIAGLARRARLLVVTEGRRGATVYQQGKVFHSPAFAVAEVEPTGAGDVFAAAFLIRLHECGDAEQAARFANATASFAVEAPGTTGIPTREQVEDRLRRGKLRTDGE